MSEWVTVRMSVIGRVSGPYFWCVAGPWVKGLKPKPPLLMMPEPWGQAGDTSSISFVIIPLLSLCEERLICTPQSCRRWAGGPLPSAGQCHGWWRHGCWGRWRGAGSSVAPHELQTAGWCSWWCLHLHGDTADSRPISSHDQIASTESALGRPSANRCDANGPHIDVWSKSAESYD